MIMPFLPASGGIPQPTAAQCDPVSFTSPIAGGADGAAGGQKEHSYKYDNKSLYRWRERTWLRVWYKRFYRPWQHTCCVRSCTSSGWFTQAPWVASLGSDVVLSKRVKSRDDHFTIWVSHCSSYCLVSGRGCIDVVCHTNTGSSWCRCPGDLDGVCGHCLGRHTWWGCQPMESTTMCESKMQQMLAENQSPYILEWERAVTIINWTGH